MPEADDQEPQTQSTKLAPASVSDLRFCSIAELIKANGQTRGTTLAFAELLEREFSGFVPPPEGPSLRSEE